MPADLDQRVRLIQAVDSDFDRLAALRIDAMRESLERVGRFDPERARERLRNSFHPEHTRIVILDGGTVGFFTFRPIETGFKLDHFYIHPDFQSKGLGSLILRKLCAEADSRQQPIHLGALKESRSNQFYRNHGFEQTAEDGWDTYYSRACGIP